MPRKKSELNALIGKGHYTYITDEKTAMIKLHSMLNKYPEYVRTKVITQLDELGTTPSKMIMFIEATERYNKNAQKAYNKAIRTSIKPAWNKVVEEQSDAWKRRMFTDKGTLSKEGEDAYNNFVKDRLADIVPTQEKSITLSKTQMEHISFEKTLLTRLSMGIASYTNKRTEQYFKNYEKAIREKRKNPEKFLELYNSLTFAQKIEFSYSAMGYIKAQYTAQDEEALYREMEEEINQIKGG